MRTPRSLLLTLAFPIAALAGCVAGGGGVTGQGAASELDVEATAWAADAILLGLYGSETRGVNATDGLARGNDVAEALANATDDGPIDGRLGGWAGAYWSDTEATMIVLVRGAEGVERIDMPAAASAGLSQVPKGIFDAAQETRAAWSIDSPAALEAVRAADADIDAALAGERVRLEYGLDLMEGVWQLEGESRSGDELVSFRAEVDVRDGTVTVEEVGSEPIGPIGIPIGGPEEGPLPPPIHEEGTTTASADPLNFAGLPPCSSPTAQCQEIPFTVGRDVTIEAKLEWGVPANDYDFYILDASGSIVVVGASAPGMVGPVEEASGTLTAGSYTVQVVPWSAVQDSWTFDATFS